MLFDNAKIQKSETTTRISSKIQIIQFKNYRQVEINNMDSTDNFNSKGILVLYIVKIAL